MFKYSFIFDIITDQCTHNLLNFSNGIFIHHFWKFPLSFLGTSRRELGSVSSIEPGLRLHGCAGWPGPNTGCKGYSLSVPAG